ncbi:MAG TPA: integrase core domain-containing protein [Chitinophagaceae bacterium]|nr:integrase core domain-containing protein [Chitinophagaceae bacterium]
MNDLIEVTGKGVLDAYILSTIHQAREETICWMKDYNNHHPHGSLGDTPPAKYK